MLNRRDRIGSSAKNAAARSLEGGWSAGPFRKALHALLLAGWVAVPLIAQDKGAAQPVGFPTDWSSNHLIFTDGGNVQSQLDAQRDPRAWMQWVRQNQPLWRQQLQQAANIPDNLADAGAELARRPREPRRPRESALKGDWNFDLWTGGTAEAYKAGVAPYSYMAKYSFNPIAAADCTNDFVIFGMWNIPGSPEANLVGVNNLYVGPTSPTPLCGTITNNGGSGTAPTPQVKWAFHDTTSSPDATNIPGSVVLNLTGTKVAYVLNGTTSYLRVITLGAGGGTVTSPKDITSLGGCNTAGPSYCSVTLGGSAVHSAIFADYANDVGYVGDNSGNLYKITGLFQGTPTLAGGVAWVTADTEALGAPVYDSATGTVFVGSANGKLYGFKASDASAITNSPLTLAYDSGSSQGIYSPPIVDSTNHVLYAFYGKNSAGTGPEVAQVVYYDKTAGVKFVSGSAGTPGSTSTAVAGTNKAAIINTVTGWVIPAGAFSHSYFDGTFSASTSFLYTCGSHTTDGTYGVGLQQFQFNSSRVLQSTATEVNVLTATGHDATNFPADLCSPVTEFYNTTGTPTDYLFVGVPAVSNIDSIDITGNAAGSSGNLSISSTTPLGGTSGIIVDGASASTQASSLYFTALVPSTTCTTNGGTNAASPANTGIGSSGDAADICAYKLTQSGLQ